MAIRRSRHLLAAALMLAACGDPPVDPIGVAPSFHRDHDKTPTVVVDPDGRHDATTIQAGIDLAPAGGLVRVLPGSYDEALVINKGLVLEGARGHHDDDDDDGTGGSVVVAPTTGPVAVINVVTEAPVAIRGLTIQGGTFGIRANGIAADLTVERTLVRGFASGAVVGISMVWVAPPGGGPARLVVRDSRVEGDAVRPSSGISTQGDVNGVIEGNVVRRTSTRCINVAWGATAVVTTTVDIRHNDVDECGTAGGVVVTANGPKTGTRAANVVGNTIRNSGGDLIRNGVYYEGFTGRIEHNSILGVVPPSANPNQENLVGCCLVVPAGVFVGSFRAAPTASVTIRFNEIAGNAFAGLRLGPNQLNSIDARCNWWGSASGPSGVGTGTGDAVLVETGGARPVLAPFATGLVARHRHHGDHDEDDGDDGHGGKRCHLDFSLWSEPVNLGGPINTTAAEFNATLSPNGLSLYFGSTNRPGGLGGNDIWVSRRACLACPWEAPLNLGAVVNTAAMDNGPSLSDDGRLLFLFSDRSGGFGGTDLYVSRRADPTDDFGWEPPVNLGPDVNTADGEAGPEYFQGHDRGAVTLFFGRQPAGGVFDMYQAPLSRDGETRALGVLVPELSPGTGATVRADGKELLFLSSRTGTLGLQDLWVSMRRSLRDPWSVPENLGVPMNSTVMDRHPSLSRDGRTVVFASNRPGGAGGDDIWMSTRTRIGRHDH